jgi:bacillolysin
MTMRRYAAGFIAVAMLAGTQVAAAGASSAPSPSTGNAATSAERLLRASSDGPVTIRRDNAGHTHFVGTAAGRPVQRPPTLPQGATTAAAARAHLTAYGALFGISDQARQLRTERATALGKGQTAVRFQQLAGGVPVLGGELVSVIDSANNLLSISGETSTAVTSSTFSVTAAAARAAALRVTATDRKLAARAVEASAPQQWLYDASLFDSKATAGSRAVWRVEVTAPGYLDVRELVLIDAVTGGVVLHVDEIEHAENRVVCDNANQRNNSYLCDKAHYKRTETGPVSTVTDVNAAFDNAHAASVFYASLGVDLTTLIGSNYGDGVKLRSTVRVCGTSGDCPLQNAFWDGFQMVYGSTFSRADDVVGHELTHGVTQHTSGLVYWFQSGAINESMSDVFGEFIDQQDGTGDDTAGVKWLLGEDLPNDPPARNMKDPTALSQPDRVGGSNWDPATDYYDNGAVHNNSGPGNKAAYLITDGTAGEPGGVFNGANIPTGLGVPKAKWIYWGAEQIMTPGSDYADLADALYASCSALVGGVQGIVIDDCNNVVTPATTATQMLTETGPTAPQNFTITGGYKQIRMRWSTPASDGGHPINSYVLIVTPMSSIGVDNFLPLPPGSRDVTIVDLPAGKTLTFGLMAVTEAGNSAVVSHTLKGTRLSLATASTVPYKRRTHLTGHLTLTDGTAIAGRTITLYRKLSGQTAYHALESKLTGSAGTATFTPLQSRHAWYFVAFPANSTVLLGSHSTAHKVLLAHRLKFTADDLSVRVGHPVHFAGRVFPRDRATATLQRRRVSATTWKTFATVGLTSKGRFKLAWTPRGGADFAWRVVVKKSKSLARGVSRTLIVHVT